MGRITLWQEVTLAVSTEIGAIASMFGSSVIISIIIRGKKYYKSEKATYHRLLLSLSCFDLIGSFGFAISPFAVPADSSPKFLAIGNTASCSATGWFLQIATSVPLMNACLSLYYVLTICMGIKQQDMVWREKIMQSVVVIFAFTGATLGVALQLFNELAIGQGCWFTHFPSTCESDPEVPCTRGDNSLIWAYAIGAFPSVVSLIIVWTSNWLIYSKARNLEKATRRYEIGGDPSQVRRTGNRQSKRTKEIAIQAMLYVVIFTNTLLWQIALRILDSFSIITRTNESSWWVMILLSQFFSATAGFGNMLVYARPRYMRYREKFKMTRRSALQRALSVQWFGNNRTTGTGRSSMFPSGTSSDEDAIDDGRNTKRKILAAVARLQRSMPQLHRGANKKAKAVVQADNFSASMPTIGGLNRVNAKTNGMSGEESIVMMDEERSSRPMLQIDDSQRITGRFGSGGLMARQLDSLRSTSYSDPEDLQLNI